MRILIKLVLTAVLVFAWLLFFIFLWFDSMSSGMPNGHVPFIPLLVVTAVIGGAIWKIIKHNPAKTNNNIAQDAILGAAAGGKRAFKIVWPLVLLGIIGLIILAAIS